MSDEVREEEPTRVFERKERPHHGRTAIMWGANSLLFGALAVVAASGGNALLAGIMVFNAILGGVNVGQNLAMFGQRRLDDLRQLEREFDRVLRDKLFEMLSKKQEMIEELNDKLLAAGN